MTNHFGLGFPVLAVLSFLGSGDFEAHQIPEIHAQDERGISSGALKVINTNESFVPCHNESVIHI